MLNTISWETYFYSIGVSSLLYYVCVLFLFYRKDIQNKLSSDSSGLQGKLLQPSPDKNVSTEINYRKETSNEDLSDGVVNNAFDPTVQNLIDESSVYLKQAGYDGTGKEEIGF